MRAKFVIPAPSALGISELVNSAFELHEFRHLGFSGLNRRRFGQICRPEMGQVMVVDILDLRIEKLLVLLFVIFPDRDEEVELVQEFVVGFFEQLFHPFVNRFSVLIGFIDGRPGNQSAFSALVSQAGPVIIGVEKKGVRFVDRQGKTVLTEYEVPEKPARVSKVPLGRADLL
jgi:hypothetical protein